VFLLRKAVGDGDEGYRDFVTLPRRGYQLVEPVSGGHLRIYLPNSDATSAT
jgi:DNA-binding winged helix-turn-helix (wHTH) protein